MNNGKLPNRVGCCLAVVRFLSFHAVTLHSAEEYEHNLDQKKELKPENPKEVLLGMKNRIRKQSTSSDIVDYYHPPYV